MSQVKEAKDVSFKPLREALESPGEFLLSDFSKMDRPGLLHLGFQALDAFVVRPHPVLGPFVAVTIPAVQVSEGSNSNANGASMQGSNSNANGASMQGSHSHANVA